MRADGARDQVMKEGGEEEVKETKRRRRMERRRSLTRNKKNVKFLSMSSYI